MKNLEDKLSSAIKIALDILFIKNPIGTSIGVLFGIVMHGLVGIFSPFWDIFKVIKMSAFNIVHYMALGILSFNIKNFRSKNKIDPEIEKALSFIQQQVDEGRITKADAKAHYKKLISSVIENVQLNSETQSIANAINKAL